MDTLIQELRYAIRTLTKSPAFTAIGAITLALGIGTTTAMFSVLYQALMAPLPYAHPEQLVHVSWSSPASGGSVGSLNAPMVQYLEQNSRSFASTAAMFYAPGCNLVSGNQVQYVDQAAVSTGFFQAFAVQPVLGRGFVPGDAVAKPAQVAVISYGLWKGKLGGDPGIVGQRIKCNGASYTVVGVLPQTFSFPEQSADVWIPDRVENYLKDIGANYWLVGRVRDGVSVASAQQEVSALARRFHQEFPTSAWEDWVGKDGEYALVGLREWRVGDTRTSLLLMFGAVALVLLIAAANVAGLVLARATGRTRELATRAALGATRGRLVRQMLTETLLLSMLGGAAGLLLVSWCLFLIGPLLPQDMAGAAFRDAGAGGLPPVNGAMLGFATGFSILAGMLAGVMPALQATRGDLYAGLKQGEHGSGGGRQHRVRRVLVSAEVALAVLLLVGSTLLVRSFLRLRGVSPGMNPDGVLVTELSLGSGRYQTSAAEAQFQRAVLERVRAIPGVAAAATISAVPGRRDLNTGMRVGDCAAGGAVQYRAISPNYFALMGIPQLRGRALTDSESAPVAIINQALTRNRCWAGQDPLGRQLWMARGMGDAPRQVVGIVGDTHDYGPAAPATPTVYVPQWQVPDGVIRYSNSIFYWSIVVRAAGIEAVGPAIERAVREVDPEQAVVRTVPLTAILGNWLKESRTMMQVMGAFASLALLLTAIGLYGVLSYNVTQRTREIGIRMALGAKPQDVLASVIGEGMVLVGIGAVIGAAGALAATRLMKTLLFGVRATDPATFAAALAVIVLAAVAASYVPARRATRVDPMIALRYE